MSTCPVSVTLTEACPAAIEDGVGVFGVAGGGAFNLATRTPYESAAFVNSWTVHIDMSSIGSTLVNEKSPQRRGLLLPGVSAGL